MTTTDAEYGALVERLKGRAQVNAFDNKTPVTNQFDWETASAIEALIRERDQARKIIGECAGALQNGAYVNAELATLELMAHVPDEIRLVCRGHEAHIAELIRERDAANERLTAAVDDFNDARKSADDMMAFWETVHKASEARITELEAGLREVIAAHDDNSGAEPSLSIFERNIDRARALLSTEASDDHQG